MSAEHPDGRRPVSSLTSLRASAGEERWRHDLALVRASSLYDPDWYLRTYRDVRLLGADPAEHYLRYGARIGRSPGPLFDGVRYLKEYPDVRKSGVNPLLHYLVHGRHEGRIPRRLERVRVKDPEAHLRHVAASGLTGQPQRMFASYDFAAEEEFLDCVETIRAAGMESEPPLVTVVMPTYDRGRLIGRAIESVLAQTHRSLELLIVDDGSTDESLEVIQCFDDPRVRVFHQDHRGVSAARNVGLANARGDWIFYLDSDNRWPPHFLAAMLSYLSTSGQACGYSGIAVEDDRGAITGYRGEPFDWEACFKGNYVDLNAFCHQRSLYDRLGGFDESLRRMVDWDLILRYTRQARPAYAPFIGCYYRDSQADQTRISISQPIAYRGIVQAKNRMDAPTPERIAQALQLRFAIKIPAPFDKRKEWGDFHFADSLKASLERLGHTVAIDFLGDWYTRPVNHDHVVIVLRGLTAYEPRRGHINLLWNISHPDQVAYEEYAAYDRVYLASLSYPALLRRIIDTPVGTLLQCADTGRFPFIGAAGPGTGLLFVGNSRNEYRRIVRWAIEADADLAVYGTRWKGFIDDRYIAGDNIENIELASHYASAAGVLNDHWDSMRDFGFVSNRIFDAISCGGRVISDAVPAISRLFPDDVVQVDSATGLRAAAAGRPVVAEQRRRAAEYVGAVHSFDARARAICNDVLHQLGLPAIHSVPDPLPATEAPRLQAGLLLQHGRRGPTSSGYIRLIAPLTVDASHARVDLWLLDGPDDPRVEQCDVCIVQRVAIPDQSCAKQLTDRLRAASIPLVVDTDDAFALLEAEHPEAGAYHGKDAALRHLMTKAAEVWFSTERLRACYPEASVHGAVVANGLDPRLWRDYRKPRRVLASGEMLELLYMGTATHDADFALLLPALDHLHARYPGRFRVTAIGALRQPPERPWLHLQAPPRGQDDYPRFARWLSRQGPFDVGLAPLVDNVFNACKSDIKFLDYSALGILSMVSEVPAYAGTAGARGLALCVPNTDEDWFASLESVLVRLGDFEEIARRAEEYVWSERSTLRDDIAARLLGVVAARRCQREGVYKGACSGGPIGAGPR